MHDMTHSSNRLWLLLSILGTVISSTLNSNVTLTTAVDAPFIANGTSFEDVPSISVSVSGLPYKKDIPHFEIDGFTVSGYIDTTVDIQGTDALHVLEAANEEFHERSGSARPAPGTKSVHYAVPLGETSIEFQWHMRSFRMRYTTITRLFDGIYRHLLLNRDCWDHPFEVVISYDNRVQIIIGVRRQSFRHATIEAGIGGVRYEAQVYHERFLPQLDVTAGLEQARRKLLELPPGIITQTTKINVVQGQITLNLELYPQGDCTVAQLSRLVASILSRIQYRGWWNPIYGHVDGTGSGELSIFLTQTEFPIFNREREQTNTAGASNVTGDVVGSTMRDDGRSLVEQR